MYRASADFAKCGLDEMKFFAVVPVFVKLQRPPPEMAILAPDRLVMLEHDHATPARARHGRAHQPGSAPADDYNVSAHGRRSKLFVDIHNLREYVFRARARPLQPHGIVDNFAVTPDTGGDR